MKNASPMVAMNSVIGGWLTSGRRTMRSVSRPSTTIATSVSGTASQKCKPCSVRLTQVSAAKNTIEPWAKLNTPEAL